MYGKPLTGPTLGAGGGALAATGLGLSPAWILLLVGGAFALILAGVLLRVRARG
ncbi:hypothetical protein [Streptomyces sp. NPDC003077]|uniref:hypothetical protein n=1 Tax=Streptomyces sp. NPDC003077 TaxID=3154443 RepID=UPI0033B285F0